MMRDRIARNNRRGGAVTVRRAALFLGVGMLMAACDNNWQPVCQYYCAAGGPHEPLFTPEVQ